MRTLVLATASALAISLAGSAMAADLVIEEPAPVVVPVMDWTGPYIGVHAGWGTGTIDWNWVDFPDNTFDFDVSGWLVGLQAGYNWQMDGGFVFGLEGDITWNNFEGDDDDIDDDAFDPSIDWSGSLRGRAGFGFDTVLIYGTAGLAFASHEIDAFDDFAWNNDSNTHVGWTVGVGAEVLVTDNMSVRGEYRFSSFSDENFDIFDPDLDASFDTNTFTVGLNFQF